MTHLAPFDPHRFAPSSDVAHPTVGMLFWLWTVPIALCVVVLLYAVLKQPSPPGKAAKPQFSQIVLGHRGGALGCTPAIPENTLAAYRFAMSQGADAIEIDCFLSKDDHVVISHDAVVDTEFDGPGRVNDLTLEQLKALRYKSVADEYKAERIPTLEEVVLLVKSSPTMGLMVEIKEKRQKRKICQLVIQLLTKHGLEKRSFVACFDPVTLYQFRSLNRSFSIASLLLVHFSLSSVLLPLMKREKRAVPLVLRSRAVLWAVDRLVGCLATPICLRFLGCQMVGLERSTVTAKMVDNYARSGIVPAVWVVNNASEMQWLLPSGASIITDYTQVAKKYRLT